MMDRLLDKLRWWIDTGETREASVRMRKEMLIVHLSVRCDGKLYNLTRAFCWTEINSARFDVVGNRLDVMFEEIGAFA